MFGRRNAVWCSMRWLAVFVLWTTVRAESPPEPARSQGEPAATADADDAARKAALLASGRWRRAMFEFNAWLDEQPVYDAAQVRRIRGELDARVTAMSSFELEYLLEGMDAKLRILERPAARDARGWLGRYLAVMSDGQRARTLGTVPDILDMSATELEAALERVEARRAEVERSHAETVAGRRRIEGFRQATSRATAADRDRQAEVRAGAPSFSPYRGPLRNEVPFAEAYDSPTAVGVGPWGSFMRVPVGAF